MTGSDLVVGPAVVREAVRHAVVDVPGVVRIGRSGGPLRRHLGGSSLTVRLRGPWVDARVTIVARPGLALPALTDHVRAAIVAALERQLGLVPGEIIVSVDGVGA